MGYKGAKFRKVAVEFLDGNFPQCELADAWGVHNPGSEIEANQFGGGGRMAALLCGFADLTNFQLQAGLNGIEQGTFADAALSGKNGLSVFEKLP
jgi:hypothetical protein